MKSYLKTPSLCALALASLGLMPSLLSAETFDFEFQAGQTEVTTNKFQEIDKRGYALGLSALKRISLPIGDFALGIGAMTSKVEGKQTSRGITQDLSLNLLSLDLRYLYTFYPSLSVGPVLRAYFGRGAKYSVQNNDDVDFQFAPGIMLRYAFPNFAYEPAITLHYSHDANIAKRNIQTILLGVGITTGFGEDAVPAAPIPASPSSIRDAAIPSPMVETDESAEEKTPASIVEIPNPGTPAQTNPQAVSSEAEKPVPEVAPLVFNFAPNSTRLNGISRERAKALAKLLVENPNDYGKIYVTGHSDKSGDPKQNIELSKKRTNAFCDLMANRGVPRKRMRCEALDFQKLLPGLPDNAEEHRRIEVVFEDLTPAQVLKWQHDIQKALQL